jgi:hypothetical protein
MARPALNRSIQVKTLRGIGQSFKQAEGRWSRLSDAAACRSRRWFQGDAKAHTATRRNQTG